MRKRMQRVSMLLALATLAGLFMPVHKETMHITRTLSLP